MSGCGSGSCGCSSTEASQNTAPQNILTTEQTAAYEALSAEVGNAPAWPASMALR